MYRSQCVILVTLCYCYLLVNCNVVRSEDICGPHNGRRLYLELAEKGILYAKNVSLIKNSPRQHQASRIYVSNSSHDQCSLVLVTCPSCVITVTFKSLSLPHHCNEGGIMMDSPCRCDYVWISEPPYEEISGAPYCGLYSPVSYRSSTRTLSIALFYSQSHRHAFTLEYTAERNRIHLKGADGLTNAAKGISNTTSGGILTSPFFPARYPRDLGMEYVISCPSEAPSCRVRVLFSDFQLATVSIMEFYDWNSQRLDVSSGARFRPPVIVSSGPSLVIRFYANGGTGLGYKAFYSFVFDTVFDKTISPITDCGGYVENLGGAITMMDMVGQGAKTYDCVWLIRPPKNFLHMKTHMYLHVVTFADMAGNTELTIKQGPTSALLPLEVLRHPASQLQPSRLREHVAPVTSGFHVSLRGTFGPTSRVAIAYAAFSYMDCFTGSDFLCQNHRCIPSQLNCDGFDHCGDNSDEPATCFREWEVEPQDRKWHMNKANYYFPKIDRYPDLKTATLVFVASSLGLIILISALIILLYRIGARARQQRELQSRLQTISELLDGARIDELTVSDDPPVYEAPPGYDEVVKVGVDGIEVTRRRKRRNLYREPRSRSSPNQRSRGQDNNHLLPEGVSTSRGSQTTPVSANSSQIVPESPPPPYITPPGTIPRNLNVASLSRISNSVDIVQRVSLHGHRIRTAWLRNSVEHSRSLPIVDTIAQPSGGLSTSVDAEALGAYLQNYASTRNPVMAATPLTPPVVPPRSNHEHRDNRDNRDNRETSTTPETPSVSYEINASQSNNCRDASTLISSVYEDTSAIGNGNVNRLIDVREVEAESQRREASIVAIDDPNEYEDYDVDETEDRDRGRLEVERRDGCSCAGACGCAINEDEPEGAYDEIERHCRRPHRRKRHRRDDHQFSNNGNENNNDDNNNDADSNQDSYQTEFRVETPEGRRSSENDAEITKRSIVRLLGSSSGNSRNSQNCSLNSTSHSTASSTPSGTYGRSYGQETANALRRISTCSRDSRITACSTISSTHSNDGFNDDFEIVSENTSILGDDISTTVADTPTGTPRYFGISARSNGHNHGTSTRRRRRSRGRTIRPTSLSYSNCDIDGLYESIQALDTFLARRGVSVNQGRNQSVAVMLFGTPEHTRVRIPSTSSSSSSYRQEPNEATGFINGTKSWRSSDDAFSN